ncbi:MAG: glucose 1-dehydrogenase [Candidatus Rokubacteria bacterium]|nr:glucose 1-dehydrogenase [Candidatus Rokubacteria bacterium]
MADPPLAGKIALVVGAATGIGRAIARELAGAGAAVVCADLDGAGADATAAAIEAAGGRALARRSDVTRAADAEADVAAARAAFGGLDVLVFGAATLEPTATVLELSEADWNRTLAVNLTGAFLVSRAALPALRARGGGSIIFIASQLGRVGAAGRPAYCATKGALVQLAKVMAADHARDGVRVNTLSPGAVETGRLLHRYGDMAAARAALGPKHLLGRLGQPEEIARAALFLASDASTFMTGADLLVDGGYTAVR